MIAQATRPIRLFLIVALMLLTVVGCRAAEPWAEVGGKRYYVQIADDDQERQQGLMFVDSMPDNEGMLFTFRSMEPRAFWMLNTRIPLDILYLDDELRIVAWSLNTPPCRTRNCPNYPSERPAQYVLEVNAGEMEALGVEIGDVVTVRNVTGIQISESN
ncbi:MAG: DUF192 domain-containing protein [Pseudomonadota bacterium]